MWLIFASSPIQPEIEAIDRDPGIVSFVFTVLRSACRGGASVAARIRSAH